MSEFLKAFDAYVQANPFGIIRISEVRNDKEIETHEYMKANPCQNTYSVAKTFTATAIGMLYDRGLVSPEDKVCEILADELPEQGMDERWRDSTVRMALTHRLGLPGGFLDIDTHESTEFGRDFLHYMLTYPLEYTPDTKSLYSDGAFYLLARIAEKITGMPLDSFLWEELLADMDVLEMAWSHCPVGHVIGATGMYIRSSDMAKLGMLYLNGGEYRGKRLLSREWVDMAMECGFGLDWDAQHKVCSKGGMFGQKLMIVPEQHRVVAVQAFDAHSTGVTDWVREYGDKD